MIKSFSFFSFSLLIVCIARIQILAQVGIKYTNQETFHYASTMKSADFTYLTWDRNHNGDGHFISYSRPMFFYWDNDDGKLGYLIDTRNMTELKASFYSVNLTSDLIVNGKMGIGTASPFAGTSNLGLHIARGNHSSLLLGDPRYNSYGGIVQTSDNKHRLFIGANLYDDATNSWRNFQSGKGGTGISIIADKGGWGNTIAFYVSEQDNMVENRMVIKGSGNVGIGNTNPTERLVVDGKIMAEEILVENVPSSDFVFEPDYDLKPIEEVEAFIKENKHLPDIPSAAEFKENGVGLGEMDDMLLRKVEELTLYVIELKKENEELKKVLTSQGIRTELQFDK